MTARCIWLDERKALLHGLGAEWDAAPPDATEVIASWLLEYNYGLGMTLVEADQQTRDEYLLLARAVLAALNHPGEPKPINHAALQAQRHYGERGTVDP